MKILNIAQKLLLKLDHPMRMMPAMFVLDNF